MKIEALMKKNYLKLWFISAIMLILPATAGIAQEAFNHGFGNRAFLIQSAPEVGKSANGFWDIPGTPEKTDGNFKKPKGGKWLQIQLWQIGARNDEDRLYKFRPGRGNATGRYFISIGLSGNWGVKVIDGAGKIEAREHDEDHFELKHMGNGRWKIYYKNGMIVAPAAKSAKNGTKLVLLPDQNSLHVQWVFLDPARKIPFIPFEPKPASVIPDFFIKNQKFEYSAEGNFFYYKAKGTAEVTKIEGDVAYVTVNISESESEGEKGKGIVKKGKSTFEAKFTRKGDTYFIDKEKNGDMASSGMVDPSGLYLRMADEGGGKTFKAVK